jgi:hypothetical protein
VRDIDPRFFIYAGVVVAIIGFFLIHPYSSDIGPLENAMTGSIPIGNSRLPYRFILVLATVVIAYGFYKLRAPKDLGPRR